MKKSFIILIVLLAAHAGNSQINGKIECPVNVSINLPANSINTAQLKDGAITKEKIASGQVVKSLNGLKDEIKLVAGNNITITPNGNNLTISAGIGSGSGAGTAGFWTLNGNNISNTNNGNVGIGTASPDCKLHVSGDLHLQGGSALMFEGGPSDPNYFLRTYSAPNEWGMRLNGFSGVRLSTGQGDILNVFHDKVGIGTTSPSHLLDVSGSGSEAGIHITNTGNNASVLRFRKNAANKWGIFLSNGNDDKLYFYDYINNQSKLIIDPSGGFQFGSSKTVVISSTGKIGIGTTSPLGQLHIKTSGSFISEGVVIENPNNGGMTLSMNQGTAGQLNFSKLGSPTFDLLTLDFNQVPVINGRIDKKQLGTDLFDGSVGIGTNKPQYRLHVVGSFNVDGPVYYKGVLLPQPPSDLRLKKDIKPIMHPFEILDAINGIQFKWKTEEFTNMGFTEGNQFGIIAQEVEKVLPSAVSVMNDGYKTVDYTRLIPVLIEAIKEQQKKIDGLEQKLNQIKSSKE